MWYNIHLFKDVDGCLIRCIFLDLCQSEKEFSILTHFSFFCQYAQRHQIQSKI